LIVAIVAIGLAIAGLSTDGSVLDDAVRATGDQGSYRFNMTQETSTRALTTPTSIGFQMNGIYNAGSGFSRFTFKFTGPTGQTGCTAIASPETWYIQVPESKRASFGGKAWVRSEPPGTFPGQGLAATPTRGVSIVDFDLVSDLEEIGDGTVRGVRTKHYRGEFDWRRTLGRDLNPALEQLNVARTIPIEFWIDDDDLIRRTTYTVSVPSGTVRVDSKLVFESYDFGVNQPVSPPPDDQVQNVQGGTQAFSACLAA
jgi:hypothetical protein